MKPKYIYAAVTALISILFGVMLGMVPMAVDDIWYLEDSTGQPGSWEYFITTLRTCIDHLNWDTGRLANVVTAPFLSLMPHWVSAVVSALAVWLILLLGPAITRCGWISVSSALWVASLTFIYPWSNNLFLIVHSSNYTWALALGLILIYIFFRHPGINGYRLAGACVLAFLVGWWHEGQSAPLFLGLSVFLLCRRTRPARQELILLFFLGMGILTLTCMPAFWNSVDNRSSYLLAGSWRMALYRIVSNGSSLFLLIGITAIGLSFRKLRSKIVKNKCLGALLCGLAAFDFLTSYIALKYYNGPRTTAFLQMYNMLGVILLGCSLWSSKKGLKFAAMCLVTIAALIHMSAAISVQRKLSAEFETARPLAEQAKREGKHFIFCDYTPRRYGIAMDKPTYGFLNSRWGFLDIMPVPMVYKDFSIENSEYTVCQPGLFLYKNKLLAHGFSPSPFMKILVHTADGREISSQVELREFVTAEGDSCTAIILPENVLAPEALITHAWIGKIKL